VGHTHEDIDQFFSRIAIYLRANDALSRSMLARCIRASFKKDGKRPIVVHWASLGNVSDWMDSKGVKAVPGITDWRHFRVRMNADSPGETTLHTRNHMAIVQDDLWDAPGNGSSADFNCIPEVGLNLVKDILAGDMPDTQLRVDTPPEGGTTTAAYKLWKERIKKRAKWRKERAANLLVLQLKMPNFTNDCVDDCMDILALEERTEPIPWCWPLADVQYLFADKSIAREQEDNADDEDKDSPSEDLQDDNDSAEESGLQDLVPDAEAINRGHANRRAGPKTAIDKLLRGFADAGGPQVGDYWLLKPARDRSGRDVAAPFYVARVKRNVAGKKSSHVMWYSPKEGWGGESPYMGKYAPEKAPGQIAKLDLVPWDTAWQWPLTFTTKMKPTARNIDAMKKWAKKFADQERDEEAADDIRIGSGFLPVNGSDSNQDLE
jgi:hypothetical protein